jgi:phospholipid/cholesterol/gamma-HCH transport system substrate-binding protein
MERTTIDIWVGIFVALGAAALLALAMKVGNLTSSSIGETYGVTAAFDNIGGLKPRAPVKSAGVVVGRVDAINFDSKTYKAIVDIKIDKRYQFSTDTIASILTAGLLGDQYIGLEVGGEPETLKEGDKIEMVQDALVLEKLIGQFLTSKSSESSPSSTPTEPTATLASPTSVE